MFCPHIRSARADGIPTTPSEADIEAAYLHSRWLRGQVCNGEGRMLADLGYEVQRLRDELAAAQAELRTLREDRDRLDWLEGVTARTNARNFTTYGWRYDINHNRASLTDCNLPALSIRAAIDAASQGEAR
jgi:hypothetical protein